MLHKIKEFGISFKSIIIFVFNNQTVVGTLGVKNLNSADSKLNKFILYTNTKWLKEIKMENICKNTNVTDCWKLKKIITQYYSIRPNRIFEYSV